MLCSVKATPPSSEIVADLAPGARVVKALNTLYYKNLEADPRQGSNQRVLFLSGDDNEAKAHVSALLDRIGFAPIDLGGLAAGGRMQQFDRPLHGQNLLKIP